MTTLAYTETIRCARCNVPLGDVEHTPETGHVMALCAVCFGDKALVMVSR